MQGIQKGDRTSWQAALWAPRDRASIFERDRYTCAYCGVRDESADFLLVDHAVPIARGGVDLPFNLKTACWICHRRKGNKTEEEFLRSRGDLPSGRRATRHPSMGPMSEISSTKGR